MHTIPGASRAARNRPAPHPPTTRRAAAGRDRFIDTTLRRVVYGTLAGGLAAAALMRGPLTRTAAVAFGSGWGAGSAWTICSKDVSGGPGGRTRLDRCTAAA